MKKVIFSVLAVLALGVSFVNVQANHEALSITTPILDSIKYASITTPIAD
ncbi:hypothetical protein [Tumebacillus algifaecis]|nr:hypothetical protein [Tumebacillus algifaecis]